MGIWSMSEKKKNWEGVWNYGFMRCFARFTCAIGQFIGQFNLGIGENRWKNGIVGAKIGKMLYFSVLHKTNMRKLVEIYK